MNILVINGSPKGNYSITLQTVNYLMKKFPVHSFEVLNAGKEIKKLCKDIFPAIKAIEKAQLIIFAYPVYTFIAPWQLHRLIELLKEQGVSLKGKCASQITTSKHFYDTTAHRYIQDNCADLQANYIRGLSADMDDLLSSKGQKEAEEFFKYLLFACKEGLFEKPSVRVTKAKNIPVSLPESTEKKQGDIAIVTNCADEDTQLHNMIARFGSVCKRNTRVINIAKYPFKGGCLGCFNCAVSGKCVYRDNFDEFLRNDIQKAQAIVFAFTVKDHSMGASFKLYDDRQFCNGHRTVTMGMPMGYIVSGNLSEEENLRTIIEGRAQVGGNFLAGVAGDEVNPDAEIDSLAKNLEYALENGYNPPSNFYGIGGMKIFRDLIWLMQGMMRADHKFYKAHNQYDFPQKKRGMMLKMYLVGFLIASPKIKAKMGNAMNEGMLMPYKKVLEKMDKEQS